MHGLRAYASYGMGHIFYFSSVGKDNNLKTSSTNTELRMDVNIDYLNDFVTTGNSSFGAYVGLFIGYGRHTTAQTMELTKYASRTTSQFIDGVRVGFNLGLAAILAKHSRIEFGVKIPAYGPTNKEANIGTLNNQALKGTQILYHTSVIAGYSFVF